MLLVALTTLSVPQLPLLALQYKEAKYLSMKKIVCCMRPNVLRAQCNQWPRSLNLVVKSETSSNYNLELYVILKKMQETAACKHYKHEIGWLQYLGGQVLCHSIQGGTKDPIFGSVWPVCLCVYVGLGV